VSQITQFSYVNMIATHTRLIGAEYDSNVNSDQMPGQSNPSLEFFPPKGDGKAIPSQFLKDAHPTGSRFLFDNASFFQLILDKR
jgi:hypothetical protein